MENNTSNTNNFLNWVEIKNFKSIKDLRLDCKRVNVFIGKPNAGKSNVLEALGLLGPIFGYSKGNYFSDIIRYTDFSDVFTDNDTRFPVTIKSDKTVTVLRSFPVLSQPFALINGEANWFAINEEIIMTSPVHVHQDSRWIPSIYTGKYDPYYPIYLPLSQDGKNDKRHNPFDRAFFDGFESRFMVKKYDYKYLADYNDIWLDYLMPPNGDNLFSIINQSKELRKDIGKLFEPDKLEFVLSTRDKRFYLQKKIDDYVYLYPYSSIADTFQRFVFYSAAIESNLNSVIVLEEPEVHSFPPYVQNLAFRVIESETNQFFISTHSPYLLQTLIEYLGDDQLKVFITYYDDYQTKVRALTAEELSEVQEFSIDVFYNLRRFIPHIND